jgi:hypothetical protein
MAVTIALCLSLLGSPVAATASAPEAPTGSGPTRQSTLPVLLRVPVDDFEPLRVAIEARLPSVRVLPHRASTVQSLAGQEFVFAELAGASTTGEVRLAVILQDGRSYERSFTADATDRVHSMATTLANTLAAIREERIEPTRKDVAIPEPEPEPAPPREVVPAPTEPIASAPPTSTPAPVVAPPTIRRFELGLTPSGSLLVGLGPGGVSGPSGGAGLDIDLRVPVGALVSIGLRHQTRGDEVARVHRFAVHVAGGYSLRLRSFELRTIAGLVIEPWFVSEAGEVRNLRNEDGDRAGPLVGGLVSLSPGWFYRRRDDSSVALRLGLRALLQIANLTSGGIGNVRVVQSSGVEEIARVGGVELVLGADATFWFTLARRVTPSASGSAAGRAAPGSRPAS